MSSILTSQVRGPNVVGYIKPATFEWCQVSRWAHGQAGHAAAAGARPGDGRAHYGAVCVCAPRRPQLAWNPSLPLHLAPHLPRSYLVSLRDDAGVVHARHSVPARLPFNRAAVLFDLPIPLSMELSTTVALSVKVGCAAGQAACWACAACKLHRLLAGSGGARRGRSSLHRTAMLTQLNAAAPLPPQAEKCAVNRATKAALPSSQRRSLQQWGCFNVGAAAAPSCCMQGPSRPGRPPSAQHAQPMR